MARLQRNHTSLDSVVAENIRQRILSGELSTGDHLVEAEFARAYEVSHGTVRSALKTLQHEGLVEFRPRRGMYVTELQPADALELCSLRDSLEALAARLAAKKATQADLNRLQAVMDDLRSAASEGNRAKCMELDLRFHRLIVDMARHSRLSAMYQQLEAQIRLFMVLTDPLHEDLSDMVTLHQPLTDAICAGDSRRSERLALRHNERDGQRLASQLEQAQA